MQTTCMLICSKTSGLITEVYIMGLNAPHCIASSPFSGTSSGKDALRSWPDPSRSHWCGHQHLRKHHQFWTIKWIVMKRKVLSGILITSHRWGWSLYVTSSHKWKAHRKNSNLIAVNSTDSCFVFAQHKMLVRCSIQNEQYLADWGFWKFALISRLL